MRFFEFILENLFILTIAITAAMLISLLTGCAGKNSAPRSQVLDSSPILPSPIESPSHALWTVRPDPNTYLPEEIEEQVHVQERINETLQGECFAKSLLDESRALVQTNGRTRAGVLRHLRTSPASVALEMYVGSPVAVGYTNGTRPVLYTNAYYFRGNKDPRWRGLCLKASLEAHEISHVLGYHHDFNRTARRPYSVPYSINHAFLECCHE